MLCLFFCLYSLLSVGSQIATRGQKQSTKVEGVISIQGCCVGGLENVNESSSGQGSRESETNFNNILCQKHNNCKNKRQQHPNQQPVWRGFFAPIWLASKLGGVSWPTVLSIVVIGFCSILLQYQAASVIHIPCSDFIGYCYSLILDYWLYLI